MGAWRQARISLLEQAAETQRAKAGKTFRRSGPHVRKALRAEKQIAKLQAKEAREQEVKAACSATLAGQQADRSL